MRAMADANAPRKAANRLGLDFRQEVERLGPPPIPVIDVHTHVNGGKAAGIFRDVMDLFGVSETWSQTRMGEAEAVREVLGERVRFIAVPDFSAKDRRTAHTTGFLEAIRRFHDEFGARIVKFYNAPRIIDFLEEAGGDLAGVDSEWRVRQAELASELGMSFMTHIADPDTWFATKYADASKYGTKEQQYEGLERMLERFPRPWIAAHMGGWPESLEFLSGLLERHDNLHLDTSATKWMVRELSKHPREELLAFLKRWRGRILFGSDLVTTDEHLKANEGDAARFGAALADGPSAAFDLYSSRYWCLRTLWETDYDGESAIADPDLKMMDPEKHDAMSAPRLRGKSLPREVLEDLYGGGAKALAEVVGWESEVGAAARSDGEDG